MGGSKEAGVALNWMLSKSGAILCLGLSRNLSKKGRLEGS